MPKGHKDLDLDLDLLLNSDKTNCLDLFYVENAQRKHSVVIWHNRNKTDMI